MKKTSSTSNRRVSTQTFEVSPRRYIAMRYVLYFLLVCLGVAIVWVQVVRGPAWAKEASSKRTQHSVIMARRGDIVDISDNILATSIDKYRLAIDQKLAANWVPIHCTGDNDNVCHQLNGADVPIGGAAGIAKMLAPLLGVDAMELAYSINGTSNYQVIAKDVAPEVQRKIAQLNLGGMISYEATGSRVYPNGNIAGPEIGAASSTPDGIQARAGIELMMDKELSGTPGEYVYEAGAYGERIPETKSTVKEAINGKSVKTTLDLDTQWELQRAIDNGKDINGASYAYGVVERVKTGEVLAIAEDHAAQAGSDEVALYGSKVFGGAFEPGSTVKVLTVAGLIENNIAQPESQFYVADHYTTSNGQVISDAHNHSMARLTLAGIVGQSFNTGTTQASEPMTADQRYQLYHSFGLGEKTAVNFPGEADGVLHNVEDWDGRTLHNVLFGQGMSVSALQIVNSYATIANNGVNPVPTIISATKGEEDENWVPFPKPKQPFRVVSETTAKRTLGVLEASVTDGICASANMPNYRVGGKTGTAEMVGANGLSDTMMSFIGVFPLDNPEFVIGIFYKNPVKAQYSIATIPAFKEVAMFLTQKFGLPASTPAEYVPPSVW